MEGGSCRLGGHRLDVIDTEVQVQMLTRAYVVDGRIGRIHQLRLP
jgi:hypothetical protein